MSAEGVAREASGTPEPRRLGSSAKAAFALGDHAINVSLSSLSLVFFTFLVTVAGMQPWLAGIIAWLARMVDAVTDPMMGRISDSLRWRSGRRRPFFLIGMLPLGISFSLLWTTPFTGQAAMFIWYLAVYVALSLSMTVLSVPYMALIPEMAVDYDERTSINTFRSAGAVVGTMVAAVFFAAVGWLGGGARGFALTGLVIGVWIVLPWPLVWKVSFEPAGHRIDQPTRLFTEVRQVLGHLTYLRLIGFYMASRIALDLLGLAVPLLITIWIGREDDVTWSLLSMLGVVILSLPLWLRYARRREKHEIFIMGAVWFVVCLVGIFLVDPSWPRWLLFVIAGLLGIGYAVVDLMPWAMLGEVIDEDELATNERREGIYSGVFTFVRKVGGATAYMLAGFGLSLAGYDSEVGVQSDSALLTIRAVGTIVPAGFLLAGIALARGYPLTRRRHGEILDALTSRASQPGWSRGTDPASHPSPR
jgi:GPH family glycoside/pentoside/hexuronide:cation symporter